MDTGKVRRDHRAATQLLAKKGKKAKGDAFDRKIAALRLNLSSLDTMVRLTNANKMLSSAVTLPRWRQIQAKIIDALQDHPEALRSVMNALDGKAIDLKDLKMIEEKENVSRET